MKLDDLHIDYSKIDGYNKPFNFIVSPREDGKTTNFLCKKSKKAFFTWKRPTILFRRYSADITDVYIQSLEDILNKFKDDNESNIKLLYNKGTKKEGVVDVRIKIDKEEFLIFRIIALNNPISRIKSLFIKNAKYMFFDEFICNARLGEKYLTGEAVKFKECFTTFNRECEDLKAYFVGNPYSLYNPYFVEFGVDPTKMIKGEIITGNNWAAWRHILNPLLVEKIKAHNPLYTFEKDAYSKYAVEGDAINDLNVNLVSILPQNFSLKWIFKFNEKYIGIYKSNQYLENDIIYWAGYIQNFSKTRNIFVFDFKDLESRGILVSRDDKNNFAHLRMAIRNRACGVQSLEINYILEEVYNVI